MINWTVETAIDAITAGDSGEFWDASLEKDKRDAEAYLRHLEATNKRLREKAQAVCEVFWATQVPAKENALRELRIELGLIK